MSNHTGFSIYLKRAVKPTKIPFGLSPSMGNGIMVGSLGGVSMKIRSCPSAPLRTGFDKALHERLSSLSPAPFRIKGFTLLEILIALAIFAILSMMAYAGLASILNARAATEPRSEQLAQLQTTLYLLNEDLSQASNRPIRDELGTAEPAFTGGRGSEILTLTRNVPLWSKDTAANSLQRISYRFENGALYRQVWAFTDRTPQSTFRRRKLINADHVTVRYFYETEQRWMSLNGSGSGVPNAVEVNFILSGLGSIQRLFLIHQ